MKSIRELLTGRAPLTVKGSMSALEAARLMKAESIGCVLIVDPKNKPLGIFTERDLLKRVIADRKDPALTQIESVMSHDPFCADAETRVLQVARTMQERHIRHLPVLENGSLEGVLSLRDLLRAMLSEQRDEATELRAYIHGQRETHP